MVVNENNGQQMKWKIRLFPVFLREIHGKIPHHFFNTHRQLICGQDQQFITSPDIVRRHTCIPTEQNNHFGMNEIGYQNGEFLNLLHILAGWNKGNCFHNGIVLDFNRI